MKNLHIREMRIEDAGRFLEILSNPKFVFFRNPPETVEEEAEFIRKALKDEEEGKLSHRAIMYNDKLVGGCGFKINQHEKHIAELGYFIDEAYWGQGLAGRALSMVEQEAFKENDILRAELIIDPDNIGSQRVAEKAGYELEGRLKSRIVFDEGIADGLIYSKINPEWKPKE